MGGRQLRATQPSLEQAWKRAGDAIAGEGLHFGLCWAISVREHLISILTQLSLVGERRLEPVISYVESQFCYLCPWANHLISAPCLHKHSKRKFFSTSQTCPVCLLMVVQCFEVPERFEVFVLWSIVFCLLRDEHLFLKLTRAHVFEPILCCNAIIKQTFNFLYFNFSEMKATKTTPCMLVSHHLRRGGLRDLQRSPFLHRGFPLSARNLQLRLLPSAETACAAAEWVTASNFLGSLGHFLDKTDGKPSINNTVSLTVIFLCFPMCALISLQTIVCSNASCLLETYLAVE